MIERGEMKKGRSIIRVQEEPSSQGGEGEGGGGGGAQGRDGSSSTSISTAGGSKKSSTHKVTLQDPSGFCFYALELQRHPRIGIGVTKIGEKVLLRRGSVIDRGLLLIDGIDKYAVLGGSIEEMHKRWVESRLKTLREEVEKGG